MLMEFAAAPHEHEAKVAKRLHDTEHAGDDTTSVGEPDAGGGQNETASIDDSVLVVPGRTSSPTSDVPRDVTPSPPPAS
jgi:hypothetical protein